MRTGLMRIDEWDPKSLSVLNDYLNKLKIIINKGIEIEDNLYADLVEFEASGAAGTVHTVEHDLNTTPAGFFVMNSLSGSTFASGGGTWDEDEIYLKTITGLGAGETDTVTIVILKG